MSLPRASRASLSSLRKQSVSAHHRALATHADVSSPSASSSSSSASSTSKATSWSPAVKPGVSPAYDAALRFISDQASEVKRQIKEVESSDSLDASAKTQLLEKLQVASEVNDPALRWGFTHAQEDQLDMSNITIRHLRERAWRKCGALDKLTERVRDQGVVPDSLSHIAPTVDLQYIISDPAGPGVGDHAEPSVSPSGDVLPGVLIEQKHLMGEPLLRLTAFHTAEKKYTLALVDLDRPDDSGNLEPYLHWLITDIPLSANSQRLRTPSAKLGNEVVPYTPPYPAKGSERHRYVTLLLEQTSESPKFSAKDSSDRHFFPLRSFVEENSLKASGIHFFRSEWTPSSEHTISRIWRRMGEREEAWGTINRRERKRRAPAAYGVSEGYDMPADAVDADVDLVEDAEGKLHAQPQTA
ncbi:unnamed protein product [Sympodiomycopsis kandeliae]